MAEEPEEVKDHFYDPTKAIITRENTGMQSLNIKRTRIERRKRGVFSVCKSFFSSVFSRGAKHNTTLILSTDPTSADVIRGRPTDINVTTAKNDTAEPLQRPVELHTQPTTASRPQKKAPWYKRIFSHSRKRRSRAPKKTRLMKDTSINMADIGKPTRRNQAKSEMPPSNAFPESEAALQYRKDTTTFLPPLDADRGYGSMYQGESMAPISQAMTSFRGDTGLVSTASLMPTEQKALRQYLSPKTGAKEDPRSRKVSDNLDDPIKRYSLGSLKSGPSEADNMEEKFMKSLKKSAKKKSSKRFRKGSSSTVPAGTTNVASLNTDLESHVSPNALLHREKSSNLGKQTTLERENSAGGVPSKSTFSSILASGSRKKNRRKKNKYPQLSSDAARKVDEVLTPMYSKGKGHQV